MRKESTSVYVVNTRRALYFVVTSFLSTFDDAGDEMGVSSSKEKGYYLIANHARNCLGIMYIFFTKSRK